MDTTEAMAILYGALGCKGALSRKQRLAVTEALDHLRGQLPEPWPIAQFQDSLSNESSNDRWQNLNASLNAIKRGLAGSPVPLPKADRLIRRPDCYTILDASGRHLAKTGFDDRAGGQWLTEQEALCVAKLIARVLR